MELTPAFLRPGIWRKDGKIMTTNFKDAINAPPPPEVKKFYLG